MTAASIPAAALAAASEAISDQSAGTSAAHMARVAIEAAAPIIRQYDRSQPSKSKDQTTETAHA